MEIVAHSMVVQKYRHSSHKALPCLEVTLTELWSVYMATGGNLLSYC